MPVPGISGDIGPKFNDMIRGDLDIIESVRTCRLQAGIPWIRGCTGRLTRTSAYYRLNTSQPSRADPFFGLNVEVAIMLVTPSTLHVRIVADGWE